MAEFMRHDVLNVHLAGLSGKTPTIVSVHSAVCLDYSASAVPDRSIGLLDTLSVDRKIRGGLLLSADHWPRRV